MHTNNKQTLIDANQAVTRGDNEGFLAHCTEDVIWEFVGDRTITGKDAVRAYMHQVYIEPPLFDVEHIIAEGDLVTAMGTISMKNSSGQLIKYAYCDVWRFSSGKMAALKAFVIEI
jgi:ketosteroid isomerase-like protein